MSNVYSIDVKLQSSILSVEYSDALLEQIRKRYNMASDVDVPESLVKMFIEQELRSALHSIKEPT